MKRRGCIIYFPNLLDKEYSTTTTPHTHAQLLISLGFVLKEEITHSSHFGNKQKYVFEKFVFRTLKFLLFGEK